MHETTAAFTEVSSPAWAFWRAVVDLGVGLLVGIVYAFLGLLVFGLVGEEALTSLYAEFGLDPILRASAGVFLAAAAVLGFGVPLVFVGERLAALKAVERMADDAVPPHLVRLGLRTSPYAPMHATGTVLFWCGMGVVVLFALAVIFTEDLRGAIETWLLIGGGIVIAVAGWSLRGLARRLTPRTADRLRARQSIWSSSVPAAKEYDRIRREAAPETAAPRWLVTPGPRTVNRIANVLLGVTTLALGAFKIALYARQPCNVCETRLWDQPIENAIDVLSLASGIAFLVCAAFALIAWIGGVLLQGVREIALARWVSDGRARRVDPSVIAPLVAEKRAATRLEYGLCAAGAVGILFGLGVIWSASESVDPTPLLVAGGGLILLGLLVGWTDAGRARRERQAIRDTLFPGDAARPSKTGKAGEAGKTSRSHAA